MISTLQNHLATGRLALFLGADLPAALTGVPGRAELAQGLAQRYGLPAGLSLAATAQRVTQGGNRFAFTDFLTRHLDTLGKTPQPLHQLLVRLPVPVIITTAYDSLLELAFQQANTPLNRVVRDSDLAFADPRQRTLIKLYGDLPQRDTLIVTEDDHYGLWRSREKEGLLDEVRRTLRGSAVLFLGYNLADPDFNLLWREVLERVGRFALGAYAVNLGLTPDAQRVWAERHVQVLELAPLALLEQLAAPYAQQVSPPPTKTKNEESVLPPDNEELAHQQRLLATHRRTLTILLEQQAVHTTAFTPPSVVHGITEARTQIQRIKAVLHGWGVPVADAPDDTAA